MPEKTFKDYSDELIKTIKKNDELDYKIKKNFQNSIKNSEFILKAIIELLIQKDILTEKDVETSNKWQIILSEFMKDEK